MKAGIVLTVSLCIVSLHSSVSFVVSTKRTDQPSASLFAKLANDDDSASSDRWSSTHFRYAVQKALVGITVAAGVWGAPSLPAMAQDPNEIVSCLFQKCSQSLGKCVLNPKCLANVVCLNTCGEDINCQIKCGDLFENEVVGEFNKCVVSDMACIQQKADDGSYPIPTNVVPKFDTSFFNGRLYITAGMYDVYVDIQFSAGRA